MGKVVVQIPKEIHRRAWAHLLPRRMKNEEVCFLYVRPEENDGRFACVDWESIPPEDFAFRSGYHIELADGVRARIIKRAHDLGASLVEMHSHTGTRPAAFSPSDMAGFAEFVPHVMWRLQGKPYFAIVVARGSFDGLAWVGDANTPQRLGGIAVGRSVFTPTATSSLPWRNYGY